MLLPLAQIAADTPQTIGVGTVVLVGSVVSGAFAIVNNAVALAREAHTRRRDLREFEQKGIDRTPGRCLLDRNRLKDVHQYTESVQRQIASGVFSCAWKDRDEVRDHFDAIRDLTTEIKALARELRLTRNGGG